MTPTWMPRWPARDALAHYRPWIIDTRLDRPYQLDDKLEQLFLEKGATGRGPSTGCSTRRCRPCASMWMARSLPSNRRSTCWWTRTATRRKAASDALAKTFGDNLRLFTLITNTLAKDKQIGDTWRRFDDVADARHLANRVEREVVDALVSAVEDAFPRLSHRYYAMKAKWMGMDTLNHWDRNAPLPFAPRRASAGTRPARRCWTPIAALRRTWPISRAAFSRATGSMRRWPGKSPGAFAHPTVPSAHPYVLLNYQGKPRDVMTLAHELGHGVHQVLAGRRAR